MSATTDPYATVTTRATPQTHSADPAQERNKAGGYTFTVDDMTRFRRFLATGTEGGTFYASEQEHTIENAEVVLRLARERGPEMLAAVLDVSLGGRAVKQHPTILSLAALASLADDATRKAALHAIPQVCRTATMLFLFAKYVEQFRGWGRALKRGVGAWYLDQDIDRLAYQVAKYQSRDGYTHRDILRLAHPSTSEPDRAGLFAYIAGKATRETRLPLVLQIADSLREAESVEEVVGILSVADNVSWEMVPSQWLGEGDVWRTLLDFGHVPLGALLRNLARLTTNGVITPLGADRWTRQIAGRLTDPAALTKARIHPMSVLLAAATYASGTSVRGSGTWHPSGLINQALNDAFPAAFGTIEVDPSTRAMIGVDVSGSMDTSSVAGLPMSCRTAAVALAQVYAMQFPQHVGVAFSGPDLGTPGRGYRTVNQDVLRPFDVHPSRRLTDVIAEAQRFPFGSTDCSLPMLTALDQGIEVDAFLVVTDNETWAGAMHPHEALRKYREKTGINARMVTVSMQANRSTIADSRDPLMLDVVGLDTASVGLVGDFMAGRI